MHEVCKQIENLIKDRMKQEIDLSKHQPVIITFTDNSITLKFSIPYAAEDKYFAVVRKWRIEFFKDKDSFCNDNISYLMELNPEEQQLAERYITKLLSRFNEIADKVYKKMSEV